MKKGQKKETRTSNGIAGYIYAAVIPVIAFYLMEFYDRNPFEQLRPDAHYLNIILYELIFWIFILLIGRTKWGIRFGLLLAGAAGLINHYVMAFRSTPFVPWDIFSIRTAASVASRYEFTFEPRVILITALFVVLFIISGFFDCRIPLHRGILLGGTAALVVVLCVFSHMLQDEDFQNRHRLYPYLFTPSVMVKYDGFAVTFTMDLQYLIVDKPAGYSTEAAQEILSGYDSAAATANENTAEEDYPNVIVIMDEAFSDLSVLGDLNTNQDPIPFVHSLQQGAENTVSGYLNVSVCGGNTANTEYEFLTGETMAFLPGGSIPYQQYIRDETPSLASYLAGLGYGTYAQHPYYASGWNRETVYPLLGFDNMTFINGYGYRNTIRGYVSDESAFDQIISTYENKEDGQPAFIFTVTMQNHGGYTDTYADLSYDVTDDSADYEPLNQYLTLTHLTDQALQELITYFSNEDEPTIIVFFGDHQPNDTIARPVWAENGVDSSNLTDEQLKLRYKVPFIIWANYDIEEESGLETSANYLAAKVLETAGLPVDSYAEFLTALEEEYPVYSAVNQERADGTDAADDAKEADSPLNQYQILQYYRLFDYSE